MFHLIWVLSFRILYTLEWKERKINIIVSNYWAILGLQRMARFIKEVTQYWLRSHSGFYYRYLFSLFRRRKHELMTLVSKLIGERRRGRAVGVFRTPRLAGRGVPNRVLFMEKLLPSFKGDIWLCMRASCTRSPNTELSLPKCGFSD